MLTVWDPDGDGPEREVLVIGGSFTVAGHQNCTRIATWDGKHFRPLGAGFNAAVRALGVYNGELLAGGDFTMSGTTAVNHIARWDGAAWQPFGGITPSNGYIRAFAAYNNELIVSGLFSSIGGVSARNIARWNGTTWQPLGAGLNDAALCMRVYNGDLVAGGMFTVAGSVSAAQVARWNGTTWSALGNGCPEWLCSFHDDPQRRACGERHLSLGGRRRIQLGCELGRNTLGLIRERPTLGGERRHRLQRGALRRRRLRCQPLGWFGVAASRRWEQLVRHDGGVRRLSGGGRAVHQRQQYRHRVHRALGRHILAQPERCTERQRQRAAGPRRHTLCRGRLRFGGRASGGRPHGVGWGHPGETPAPRPRDGDASPASTAIPSSAPFGAFIGGQAPRGSNSVLSSARALSWRWPPTTISSSRPAIFREGSRAGPEPAGSPSTPASSPRSTRSAPTRASSTWEGTSPGTSGRPPTESHGTTARVAPPRRRCVPVTSGAPCL